MTNIVLQDDDGDNIILTPSDQASVVLEDSDTPDINVSANVNGKDGQGVPAGGTTGQVLKKNSSSDYDTSWGTAASGDMTKTVYDTDNDGIIDNAEALNGQAPTYYLNRTNHTGSQAQSTITNLTTDLASKEPTISVGTTSQYWRGDKSWQPLDKSSVGLGNVDNTSDANKPVSTATQTALNAKADDSGVVHIAGTETVSGDKTFSTTVKIGANSTTPPTVTGPVLNASGSLNSPIQLNVQNQNSGTSASADLVATADTGNDTANYVNVGINSSTYNDSNYTVTSALDGYLYSNGGNLAIGTQSASKKVVFHTGGTLAANQRAQITDNGLTVNPLNATVVTTNGTLGVYSNTTTLATFVNNFTSSSSAGAGMIGASDDGAAMASGDRLGFVLFAGATGTNHVLGNSAGISAYTTEAWSTSALGSEVRIEATPNGSTTRSAVAAFTTSAVTLADTVNMAVGSTTGTKIGTATTQKIGLWNATPVVQPVATTDLITGLSSIGARAAGTAVPISTSGTLAFNGILGFTGNLRYGVGLRTGATSLNATSTGVYNFCDATTGAFAVTLPTATTTGLTFTIKKADASANAITVNTTSSQTIDGALTYSLATQYKYVTVASNGTNWLIVGNN